MSRIKELEWDEISQMKKDELWKLYKQEFRNVERRINNIKREVGWSPATKSATSQYIDEKLSKRTASRNDIVNKIAKLKNFSELQTGTVRGAKSYVKQQAKALGVSEDWVRSNAGDFWSLVDEYREQHPAQSYSVGSDAVIQAAMMIYNGRGPKSSQALFEEMSGRLKTQQEIESKQQQELFEEVFGDTFDW